MKISVEVDGLHVRFDRGQEKWFYHFLLRHPVVLGMGRGFEVPKPDDINMARKVHGDDLMVEFVRSTYVDGDDFNLTAGTLRISWERVWVELVEDPTSNGKRWLTESRRTNQGINPRWEACWREAKERLSS